MFQNVKVDIIYYKTNTDFEMEFNLCGCCRMRLLTDKSPDRKTAVHSLARAVSRSRVIMMVGPLFGNDGIMKLCAGALSTELVEMDSKAYGIDTDESIKILKKATPLITPDGIFGGCIIESGPQTMILLSDNKNIRKAIMTSLIHPYIKEMCANELTQDINSHNAAETNAEEIVNSTDEQEVIEPVLEDIVEDAVPETDGEFIEDLLLEQAIEEDVELSDNDQLENLIIADEAEQEETEDSEYTEDINDEAEGFIFGDEEDNADESENEHTAYDESYEEASAFYTEEDNEITNIADDIVLSASEAMIKGIISDADEEYEDIDEFEDYENSDGIGDIEEFEKLRAIRRARLINIPIAIIVALLLVLLAIACYCIFYIPAKDGIPAAEYLNNIFNTLFG